jgi:hypothetical protein
MYRKEFLKIDIDRAMQLAFDALGELVAMHDAAQDFKGGGAGSVGEGATRPTTRSLIGNSISRQLAYPL